MLRLSAILLNRTRQIFGSLRPFDLLRLARTTKEFRRLLMHKSAISVWRTVLAQVPGLPECPPGMNEPQWVNLAFDPHCHVSRKFSFGPLYIDLAVSFASLQASGTSNGASGCVSVPNVPRTSKRNYLNKTTWALTRSISLSESVFYGNMPYDSDEPGSMLMNLIPSRPTSKSFQLLMDLLNGLVSSCRTGTANLYEARPPCC